jgi:hypothetical protein
MVFRSARGIGQTPGVMDSESEDRQGRKRPQVVRPFPRRLFSGAPVNRNSTQEISASSNEITHPRAQTPSNLSELVGDDAPSNDPRSVYLASLTESPVSSPSSSDEQRSFSPTPFSSTSRASLTRSHAVKKSSLLSSGSSSASDLAAAEELSSSSKRHWDDLRRHFLSARAAYVQPSTTTPPPASNVFPRPSTPKQSRIPKLGLKQVVEQARGVAADQAKKFADDILRASRAVNSNDLKASRREREGTLTTMATSLNMSFMSSNANLGLSAASVSSYLPQSRAKAMRGQSSSSQSMAAVSPSSPASSTSLYTVISYYASITPNQCHLAKFLPYEGEVLSSLLVPFVIRRIEATENERSQAMEAFEIIVKTWQASDEVRSLMSTRRVTLTYISRLGRRSFLSAAFGVVKLRG